MINYSFIKILKSFSVDEMEMFENFIEKYVNNTMAVKLFNVLKNFYPEFTDERLTREFLFSSISPKGVYKESYIRNLISDLNISAEKFLKIRITEVNPKFERLYIEELKDRELHDITLKRLNALKKKVMSNKVRDHSYYDEMNFIYEINSFLIVDKSLTDNFREKQLSNVINLFLITIIEDSFYMIVEEQRVNVKHRYDFLLHLLDFVKANISDFKDSPLLMIYYYLCMCLFSDSNDEYFESARVQFRKYFSKLSKVDKKNIYSVMQLYYINKMTLGIKDYNRKFLNFLLEMLKFNVLSHSVKDSINLNLYRNILILCVMEKEISILKRFITDYINCVDPGSKESILAYSEAHLNFLQGNFDRTLIFCNNINFSDLLTSTNDNLYFKNDIKILTLKCLYEIKAFESAGSLIDTYKHFLRRSKLIKLDMRNNYLFFANSLMELIRLHNNYDEYKIIKLRSKLIESNFSSVDWIIEKLSEIKN